MHVAICDDNVADRKQFERLIKRESDKRAATTGIVYADSFGNSQALVSNPRQYDVFYIDVCHTPGVTVSDIIDSLSKKGVVAPIFLCCSDINYKEQSFPTQVQFLDKPIKTADLSQSLDQVEELIKKAPNLIELRDLSDTIYVHPDEILYAVAKGRNITITLTNQRTFDTISDIDNLFSQWESHECFAPISTKAIIHTGHATKVHFGRVQMDNGSSLHVQHSYMDLVKSMIKNNS